ncbi:hypothetical protein Ddc_20252 [Ditylenchus destructor]|nr:hypothetical protein Ddc_20252 [Ditylenchus destructor]
MKAAMVAVPTDRLVAVRSPASITGIASGSCTSRKTWPRVRPSARAAVVSPSGTSLSPTVQFRSTGSSA